MTPRADWHTYFMQIAREEEHEAWREIVRHTRQQAQQLIRAHHLSSEIRFDHTRCYGEVAAQIAGILARDFSELIRHRASVRRSSGRRGRCRRAAGRRGP